MMPIIVNIINAVLGFLGAGLKNPIFLKLAVFSFFVALLHFVVDYFLLYINFSLLSDSIFFQIASYFGLISALIIYIKLLISVFFANQIINYFRS